jgi:hypothetical protein
MKISTRQYAKRQLKWVQKQMLPVVKQARERGDEVWVYVVRGGDADAQLGEEILHRESLDVCLSVLTLCRFLESRADARLPYGEASQGRRASAHPGE